MYLIMLMHCVLYVLKVRIQSLTQHIIIYFFLLIIMKGHGVGIIISSHA